MLYLWNNLVWFIYQYSMIVCCTVNHVLHCMFHVVKTRQIGDEDGAYR